MQLPIRCFVISLNRATQRRAHIIQELKREGVDFEFQDAIDGREFTRLDMWRHAGLCFSPVKQAFLSRGEIGCALSHGIVLQRILDEKLSRALILEDDAILAHGFAALLSEALRQELSWDMLRLCGQDKLNEGFTAIAQTRNFAFLRPNPRNVLCTAYVATPAFSRKVLPLINPLIDAFDLLLRSVDSEILELTPYPVTPSTLPSTIDEIGGQRTRRSYADNIARFFWKMGRSYRRQGEKIRSSIKKAAWPRS